MAWWKVRRHSDLHRCRTTALSVLDRILLASLARNNVFAGVAVRVAVFAVHVRVIRDRHLHLVHRERLGITRARQRGAGRVVGCPLDTLLFDSGAGELGATDGQHLRARTELTTSCPAHFEASIVIDVTRWGLVEIQARLLKVGALVAGIGAGRLLVAVGPGSLLHRLAPTISISDRHHQTTTYGCSLLDSQKAQENGYVATHRDNQLRESWFYSLYNERKRIGLSECN